MPDLVHGRLAHVVAIERATGHRARMHVAPVHDVIGSRVLARRAAGAWDVGHTGGQSAVAEQLGRLAGSEVAEGCLEVDVQSGVIAFAEGGFHVRISAVFGPGVVDRGCGPEEAEVDIRRCIGGLKGTELVGYHGWGDGLGLLCTRNDVKVSVDCVFPVVVDGSLVQTFGT